MDAVFYHGRLRAKERDAIQDRFMSGDAPVIVATNAFGMGVDKRISPLSVMRTSANPSMFTITRSVARDAIANLRRPFCSIARGI